MYRDYCAGSLGPEGEIPEQCREVRAPGPWASGASAPPNNLLIPDPIAVPRPVDDMYDIEDVIGYEALWASMEKCQRGVIWKGSVASFCLNAPTNIARLCDELHDGTYVPRPPKRMTVLSPKRREIVCISFRDRVVQRSFNDVVIYPCMSRGWIYDNYACQEGKGTDFARARVRAHLEREVRANGPDGYVLTIDVRGYYDHLLYEVIGENFYQRCPYWAARFACDTIKRQYGNSGQGVNPGSQLVQIAGINYLSGIDHMIKEDLSVKEYGRYMDDLVLIGHDKGGLEECRRIIAREMAPIGLEPHPTKTRIVTMHHGFRFLGFDYFVDKDGRVVTLLSTENVKAMRRRVSRLYRLELNGFRPEGTTDVAYMGWRAHAEKGDSKKLLETNDEWYRQLKEQGERHD